MAFTLVTVTGKWERIDGTVPVGTVMFQLSYEISDGVSVFSTIIPVVTTLDNTGSISIRIPANDDPDTLPIGTHYIIIENIDGNPRTYFVIIPHTALGGTISLAAIVPYVP